MAGGLHHGRLSRARGRFSLFLSFLLPVYFLSFLPIACKVCINQEKGPAALHWRKMLGPCGWVEAASDMRLAVSLEDARF